MVNKQYFPPQKYLGFFFISKTICFRGQCYRKSWSQTSSLLYVVLFLIKIYHVFFFILFTVDVVRRKAVAIAMKHLQIQSFVTGKFSCFFMTFTTIYIEIDSCKITVMAKYSWYQKKMVSKNTHHFTWPIRRFFKSIKSKFKVIMALNLFFIQSQDKNRRVTMPKKTLYLYYVYLCGVR